MKSREISDQQYAWLTQELKFWEAHGFLEEGQSRQIQNLYGTPDERSERRGARATMTLTSLAALLVGLAVFLLIGFNWMALPAVAKLAIIFSALATLHTCAWLLRYRVGNVWAAEAVTFLACLLYGGAIFLIGQIYQIAGNWTDGIWWWAVGTLPFVLTAETLVLHCLYVGLLATYMLGVVFGGFQPLNAFNGFNRIFFPTAGALSVPFLARPGLACGYWKQSARIVALYVPLLAMWVLLQPVAWRFQENPIFLIAGVGGLFLLIAECHAADSAMAIPYRYYGGLLAAGALIPLSYADFNKELKPDGPVSHLVIEAGLMIFAAIILVIVAEAVERRRTGRFLSYAEIPQAFVDRQRWIPLGLVVAASLLSFWNVLNLSPLAPTLMANLGMLALSIWLMTNGLRDDRGTSFASGVLYFLLWAVMRYIDLFGNFGGMLGASLMFFLCGAALFGLGQYWRHRKVVSHV